MQPLHPGTLSVPATEDLKIHSYLHVTKPEKPKAQLFTQSGVFPTQGQQSEIADLFHCSPVKHTGSPAKPTPSYNKPQLNITNAGFNAITVMAR